MRWNTVRAIFSDDRCFSLSDAVSNHKYRIWEAERSQEVHKLPQDAESIMVWWARSERLIIDLYFFKSKRVTAESYKTMPCYFSSSSYGTTPVTWFSNRMALHLTSLLFCANVKTKSWKTLREAGEPLTWPPRSPGLHGCDLFLWGYIEDFVFKNLPTTIAEIKEIIPAAIASITEESLQNVGKHGIPYALTSTTQWSLFQNSFKLNKACYLRSIWNINLLNSLRTFKVMDVFHRRFFGIFRT